MDCFHVHILELRFGFAYQRTLSHIANRASAGKLFMIGAEGTQLQFRQTGLNYNRIGDILFLIYGDHCFGLLGVISTMGLLGEMLRCATCQA